MQGIFRESYDSEKRRGRPDVGMVVTLLGVGTVLRLGRGGCVVSGQFTPRQVTSEYTPPPRLSPQYRASEASTLTPSRMTRD